MGARPPSRSFRCRRLGGAGGRGAAGVRLRARTGSSGGSGYRESGRCRMRSSPGPAPKIGRRSAAWMRSWRTRGVGDAWQYMLVAEGAAEIALDPAVSLWDLAAPRLIVEEAGGRFTDFSGAARSDGGSGVASNGLVHEAVLALLAGA